MKLNAMLVGLAVSALLSSCGDDADIITALSSGAKYNEGRYDEAVAGYLSIGRGRYGGIVDLNVAVGFAALGEIPAAASVLETLTGSQDPLVVSSAKYDLAVIAFGRGEYKNAATLFRDSLRITPGRIDAMRGLEASNAAMERSDRAQIESKAPAAVSKGLGDSLLDMIGRYEESRFKPGKVDARASARDDL